MTFHFALALTIVTLAGASGQTPPVSPSLRLQLTAQVDPKPAQIGQPLVMSFRLKNVTSRAVRIADTSWLYDYELIVTDTTGQEPARTELGQKIFRGEYTLLHSDMIDLQPGEEITANVDIASIYQLTQPGTYYARAMRRAIFGDPSAPPVISNDRTAQPVEKAISNPVQFTLVPAGPTVKVQRYDRIQKLSTRLQLLAQIEPTHIKSGGAVQIRLTLKNVGSKTVRLDDSAPDWDYGTTVSDSFGREPPRTEFGNKLRTTAALRQATLDLAPGQQIQVALEITKLYQLTQPGTYSARVTRARVWTEADEDNTRFAEAVYSAPIQFTIDP